MRAPSAILRSLTLRPRPASAAVAPLPEATRFNRDLMAELATLKSLGTSTSEHVMPQLLDAVISRQKIALNSLAHVSYLDDVDREAMEEYLETNIDVLDGCNYIVERIEDMKKYMDSLRHVARFVEINATSRALDQLESCHGVEKRLKAMRKRVSSLRKIMLRQKLGKDSEFGEIVCGSKVMAIMCCEFLEHVLSFNCSKSGLVMMKQSQPCSWLRLMQDLAEKKKRGSLVMIELEQTVSAARELKELIKGKKGKENVESCVERVRRSCKELEGGLDFIEGKVRDLYKSLIDVRMALLGILSQA